MKGGNYEKHHFLWRTRVEDRRERKLEVGWLHAYNGEAEWTSLAQSPKRGNTTVLYDRLSRMLLLNQEGQR